MGLVEIRASEKLVAPGSRVNGDKREGRRPLELQPSELLMVASGSVAENIPKRATEGRGAGPTAPARRY